jgi:hypothetical protein
MTITNETLKMYYDQARKVEAETGALTIRDCMTAWGYRSTSAVKYVMQILVEAGMVRKFERTGGKNIYRTVDQESESDHGKL